MGNQELHQSDILFAAAALRCHHRIDEERHEVNAVPHHTPAERSHPAVFISFDACLVRRSESLDFDWSDADSGAELHGTRTDKVVLLAGRDLPLDVLEEGVPEDATIPERISEFTGAHVEDHLAFTSAALENAKLPAVIGAQHQSPFRFTPDRALLVGDEIAKLALEGHRRDQAPAVGVEGSRLALGVGVPVGVAVTDFDNEQAGS